MPIPALPPHPAEAPILALVIAFSTSTAQLSVDSVTGEGNALACCISGAWGLNVNCNDPKDSPSGGVIVISTVRTSPTLGDFMGALVGFHLNRWFNKQLGDKLKKLGDLGIAFVKTMFRFLGDFAKWSNKYARHARRLDRYRLVHRDEGGQRHRQIPRPGARVDLVPAAPQDARVP